MKYSPDKALSKAAASAPPVTVGSFTDDRGKAANYLGSIRGGFGNPLKTLESDRPVAELVKAGFADALRARGATVVFASVEDLPAVLEKTLREVIDKALDDSALRAALQL